MASEGQGHTQVASITRYLPSQDVDTLLSRSYKLRDFGWQASDAVRTAVTTSFSFPADLYSKPFISTIVSRYAFFRCKGVRVTFRIQSTPFHYGALMISHTYDSRYSAGRTDYFEQRAQNRPVILSAMPGSSVEIVIPWNSPEQWYNPRSMVTGSTRPAALGEVAVNVLVPLDSVGTTIEPLTISVYAEFMDPEVAGPNLTSPFPDPAATVTRSRLPRIAPPRDQSIQSEAISKAVDGLMSVAGDGETGAGIVKTVSTFAQIAGLLDKPTSVQANTLSTIEWGKDIPAGYGQSFGTKFALDPSAAIDPTFDVLSEDSKNISDLCSIPSYFLYRNIPGTQDPAALITQWNVDPIHYNNGNVVTGGTEYSVSYLAYFSFPFKYWRGSITYHLSFYTSKFVSARIRATWLPDTSVGAPLGDRTGDVYSRVIDINGDTHATLTIPYMRNTLWTRVRKPGDPTYIGYNGIVQLELVSSIVSNVAAPNIGMVVWIGGGPDYQLGYFDSTLVSSNSTYQWRWPEDQSVWDRRHASEPIVMHTGTKIQRIGVSETYDDVVSLGKRFVQVQPVVTSSKTFVRVTPWSDSTYIYGNGRSDTVSYVVRPFLYYRGSVRFKFLRSLAEMGKPWVITRFTESYNNSAGPIIAASPGTMGNMVEVEVPYFNLNPYSPTKIDDDNSSLLGTLFSDTLLDSIALYSLGDDFQLFALFAPPVLFLPTA